MGGQSAKPTRYSSLWTETWSSGIWTNRNPLRSGPTTHNEAKYYGPRNDCFWDGLNIEISQRLTCVRRPGQSVYNSQTFAAVDAFYEFRLFNTNTETIKVMADTATALYDGTGPATQNLVWTKSAGASQTFMPYLEPSRPRPDCLTPPNGATSLEIRPELIPTIPYSSCSATLKMRPISRL